MAIVPPEAKRRLETETPIAHLATCREGLPHVAPVWYRYENEVIEIVTTGTKLENIRENSRVALSIQADDAGDPDWVVTMLGTGTVIEDDERTATARRRINERYDVKPDAYDENALVRIDIGSATYRTY
ncbi:pyridoxamine 5'-phosphate oxidase family protein [Natrarchaeobius halalkaliphilus]|uniref:Pyridoxamine 5'-phosphate oxidase family protein n=1 Tax=Natrarchaeobius halalkaliphilus TaxID=1679091 RepID=A0A3N6LVH1_9EURY|nr:pyridoxamine 5'-phosphate oxidase family protein [Natrarchaeobius halalkaliphilus]RQG92717.1 pyridoxamine 5'-phosphate oxidase family protein [Natrarchaeobius halalkaliphilus]